MLALAIVVLLIILFMANCYLKLSPIASFGVMISCLTGLTAAFGYYELLAGFMISKGWIITWAQPLCLIVIFVFVSTLLGYGANFLAGSAVEFGTPVKAGSAVIFGLLIGMICSGMFITALTMAPIKDSFPYKRYAGENIDPQRPKTSFLNTDGLVTGLFSYVSEGAMSGKQSFASVHPDFLNKAYLARKWGKDGVFPMAGEDAVIIPSKDAIKNEDGNRIVLDVGLNPRDVADGGAQHDGNVSFTFAQIGLLCEPKSVQSGDTAEVIYPAGLFRNGTVDEVPYSEVITLGRDKVEERKGYPRAIWMKLAFEVPSNLKPKAVQFKNYARTEIPKQKSSNQ